MCLENSFVGPVLFVEGLCETRGGHVMCVFACVFDACVCGVCVVNCVGLCVCVHACVCVLVRLFLRAFVFLCRV